MFERSFSLSDVWDTQLVVVSLFVGLVSSQWTLNTVTLALLGTECVCIPVRPPSFVLGSGSVICGRTGGVRRAGLASVPSLGGALRSALMP